MQNYKFRVKNIKTIDKELCKFMKVCKECNELKLSILFHKDKCMKDGRLNKCNKCKWRMVKNKYTHICNYCGKEFTNGHKESKFCSRQCSSLYNKKQVEFTCEWCGKICSQAEHQYNRSKHHFCSRECKGKWGSENLTGENSYGWQGGKIKIKCDYCGVEFEKIPSLVKDNNFCSQKCCNKWRSENWVGENSPSWKPELTQDEREQNRHGHSQWRKQVLERDNYTCQLSGQVGGKLNAHHLNAYNSDKEHRTDVDNGITITEELHKLFHKLYGVGNNTKEQFEEFKQRYYNGEFREVS